MPTFRRIGLRILLSSLLSASSQGSAWANDVNAKQAGPWRQQICEGGVSTDCVTVTGNKLDTTASISGTPNVAVTSFPDNEPVNVAQMNGVAVTMGNGASGTGVQRVTIANDSTGVVGVGSFPDNEPFDLNRVAGSAAATAASGVLKVGIVGNANAAFDAANNAAAPANVLAAGFEAAAQTTTQPTAATAGNVRRAVISTDGALYTRNGGPVTWSCFVQGVNVMTQCRAAPAAGLRAYVTSASFSNQVATVQTLDVAFGTGANCATGTTALTHKWQMGTNATTTSPQSVSQVFPNPLVPTAANAICVRPSAGTNFGATLTGYDAP